MNMKSRTTRDYAAALPWPMTRRCDLPKTDRPVVIWLASAAEKVSEQNLVRLLDAAHGGASLIASGGGESLLDIAVQSGTATPAVDVFEDWSSGTYEKWTVEGGCFGPAPAHGEVRRTAGDLGKAR